MRSLLELERISKPWQVPRQLDVSTLMAATRLGLCASEFGHLSISFVYCLLELDWNGTQRSTDFECAALSSSPAAVVAALDVLRFNTPCAASAARTSRRRFITQRFWNVHGPYTVHRTPTSQLHVLARATLPQRTDHQHAETLVIARSQVSAHWWEH